MALLEDDYLSSNNLSKPNDAAIVSDFNFQSDYFSHYIERNMKKLKYNTEDFQMILVRGRKNEFKKDYLIEKEYKCLTIETKFDENRYRAIYPLHNEYPLNSVLLKPIINENEFHNFLYELVMEGLNLAISKKAPIPTLELIQIVEDFKQNDFKNEWEFKTINIPQYKMKATLQCKLTMNYFTLDLILKIQNEEIFRQEIIRTFPNSTFYKDEFKDIVVRNDLLKIVKKDSDTLYQLNLSELF